MALPTLLGGLVIPQPHLITTTTNSNLKFNRVSAASSQIMMLSMRNNFFFPSTRDGNNNTSSNSHLSLNWYHMISTPTATHTSKQYYLQHHPHPHQPVLLFDIMDTIVRDPFYHDIPAFFQMSFKELIHCKHPTAWIDFELGFIDQMELARNFFKDGRPLDLEGLKNCMRSGYSYIEGMEELLSVLKQNNYEMHALTNYPIWYEMIEDKLKLSTYLSWSFCSCTIGKRKPDLEFYAEVVRRLDVEPENCIFIDDRMRNVEAAVESGMVGLQFRDAMTLCYQLSLLGIQTKSQEDEIVS